MSRKWSSEIRATDRQYKSSHPHLQPCNSDSCIMSVWQVWPPDLWPGDDSHRRPVTREGSSCLCSVTWPRRPTADLTCQIELPVQLGLVDCARSIVCAIKNNSRLFVDCRTEKSVVYGLLQITWLPCYAFLCTYRVHFRFKKRKRKKVVLNGLSAYKSIKISLSLSLWLFLRWVFI